MEDPRRGPVANPFSPKTISRDSLLEFVPENHWFLYAMDREKEARSEKKLTGKLGSIGGVEFLLAAIAVFVAATWGSKLILKVLGAVMLARLAYYIYALTRGSMPLLGTQKSIIEKVPLVDLWMTGNRGRDIFLFSYFFSRRDAMGNRYRNFCFLLAGICAIMIGIVLPSQDYTVIILGLDMLIFLCVIYMTAKYYPSHTIYTFGLKTILRHWRHQARLAMVLPYQVRRTQWTRRQLRLLMWLLMLSWLPMAICGLALTANVYAIGHRWIFPPGWRFNLSDGLFDSNPLMLAYLYIFPVLMLIHLWFCRKIHYLTTFQITMMLPVIDDFFESTIRRGIMRDPDA